MNKKLLSIILLTISMAFPKSFDVSDPPMVYIYHFVSYDTTALIFHGGQSDESQNKRLKLPRFKKSDISTVDNTVIGKPLDPKLVSAMVTSAVAKNSHLNIAGE